MRTFTTLLALAAVLATWQHVDAQSHGSRIPDSLSFQGYLTDEFGEPITASTNLTFKLYKGSSEVWSQTKSGVPVANGLFNVILGGSGAASLDTVAFDQPIEIGITVETDAEIVPRTPLIPAPYALGMRGLYVVGGASNSGSAPNLIGGASNNYVAPGVAGATISGGGGALHFNPESGADSVTGDWGTIGGGYGNTAGFASTVGGGFFNAANGSSSTIGGGTRNLVGDTYATVPGGRANKAMGEAAFAAGQGAHALHDASFVWHSTTSSTDSLESSGPNQFLIGAAGGVGINTNAPSNEFHVVGSHNAGASVPNHVAVIDNVSTGTSADVLALRIGRASNPDTTNSFVTFVYNSGVGAGSLRGNGSGGVELVSSGSDYAEYLPHANRSEKLEPGDVVGTFAGRISRRTHGADQIMVVSTAPIVVGNHAVADTGEPVGHSRVAFLGQAPVNVRGSVQTGDLLIPSGLEDGSAVAVHPADISIDQLGLVFATAWESRADSGVGKVNAAIGIDQAAASTRVIEALHERVLSVEGRLAVLERRMMP